MNIANIEHWVLKSMTEAQVSLQNGEVPVGCLFIIRHEILDAILKTKGKVKEENAVLNRERTQSEPDNKTTSIEKQNINNTSIVEEFTHDNSSPNPTDCEKLNTENTYEDTKDKSELNTEFVSHAKDTSETANTEYPTSGNYIVLARGKNEVNATKNATRHAELVCIDQVVNKYAETYRKVFKKVTVIVNVEPCIMCMAALLELNIGEIVFTCVNDRFGYNILGRTDRTNYVEIVELDDMSSNSSDSCLKDVIRANEEKGKSLAVDSENAMETIEEIETDLVRTDNKVGAKSVETDQVKSKDVEQMKTCEDTEMKNIEKFVMKTVVDTESKIREQNFGKSKKYNVSFLDQNQRNRNLIVTQTECIANKISCILTDQQDKKEESELSWEQTFPFEERSFPAEPIRRNHPCNVFHYRKYESATMDILKLFYKGVNPNAPKHKVKNKS